MACREGGGGEGGQGLIERRILIEDYSICYWAMKVFFYYLHPQP